MRSKDIKNYISNALGISKDEIRDEIFNTIKEMVQIEVEKCLNDENRLQTVVEKEVLRQIKRNSSSRNSYIVMTMDAIYNKIDKVIHEEVLKRLVIELRDDNDKSNKEDIM